MSKKCPNCSKELPDEASFCMNCFTKITPVKAIEEAKKSNKKIFFFIAVFTVIVLVFALIISLFFNHQVDDKIITTSKQTTQKVTSTISTTKSTTTTTQTTELTTEASTTESTTLTTTATTTTQSTTKKETTQPSGTLKYSGYGNGIIITSYSGNESTITIPNKIDGKLVLAIGEKAFSGNKYVKAITFEEGSSAKAINIKPNAFYNLSSLSKLNLPSQIEADNFTNCISGCPALQSVNISEKFSNTEYYSSSGVVYKNNGNSVALILYPTGKSNSSFTLPYKVSKINNNAFKGNLHLSKIRFSKREQLDVSWSNLFSKSNLKNLETIEVYVGTDADLTGIQYFDGEILYYD